MDTKSSNYLMRSISTLTLLFVLASTSLGSAAPAFAAPGDTTRVSVDSSGAQSDNYSRFPSISDDGRYVAFESEASNLVPGDTNGGGDVFVHDRQTGATTRVSVSSTGEQANDSSGAAAISGDGRYVAFYSYASNLVAGDTNGMVDIFVHDRQTGSTTRVSVDSSGTEANGNSDDNYFAVSISGDGRFVAFISEASNLVANDTNGVNDIFVHDLQTGVTTRASVDSSGAEANSGSIAPVISSNGRYVTFSSGATNLIASDTNGKTDVFVHDIQTGQTILGSISTTGEQANGGGNSPSISGDGRFVVFISKSTNLVSGTEDYQELVYVHDRQTGQTTLASVYTSGDIMITGIVDQPTISSNGRFVAFALYDKADNDGILNIWVRDLQANVSIDVGYGNESSDSPSLSADGTVVAFWSGASNFVSGDTNGFWDIFVHEIDTSPPNPSPSVVSVLQNCPRGCNTPADPIVDFTVTFSESVTGVTADDFIVTMGGGITGATVAEVIGSGSEYIVAVNTGSGNGTLRLDVTDNDSIVDSTGNPLGGPGAGNGNYDQGDVYTVDKGVPSVTSSLRADPNPTVADSVNFTVTFSEAVNGVDASDFALTPTGGVSGAFIANVTGSGNIYTVTANTGTGDGTLRLDVLDDDSITNSGGIPLGGTGAGNGNFASGEVYTIDKSVAVVTSSLRADANPTSAASVNFTVIFSEAVTGVDIGDFFLTTSGAISGAAITGINGSGNTYTVTAGTGSGDGTLRLDVNDNDSILDLSGVPLGGLGIGNGNFTTGEEYTISRTPVPTQLLMETLRSNGHNDGWVLESAENSNQGGFKDSTSTTFVLGDDAENRQYRSILHFPTYYLPDNAVITRVLLLIKGEAIVGSNPFDTHQNIQVDIRSGPFGFIGPFPFRGLQISDFQSPSHKDAVGLIENNPLGGWYYAWLDSSAFQYIDLNGITQFRLEFQVDDDNDMSPDYIRFYSGDYDRLPDRPQLAIEYYRQ